MRINTNTSALNVRNAMTKTELKMNKTIEKLSSGLRINRAGDDAAGLAISEKMRAQVNGLNVAQRNIMDGISMIQTAEGALEEVHAMLQRVRELGVQSANGIYDDDDKATLEAEVAQLKEQIDDVVTKANFNGIALFDGGDIELQVGTNAGDTLTLSTTDLSGLSGGVDHTDLGSVDDAIKAVSDARAALGATQNRLEHTLNSVVNTSENLTAAESRIRDADMAKEMAEYSKQQVLMQAGVSIAAQANQKTSLVLSLLR